MTKELSSFPGGLLNGLVPRRRGQARVAYESPSAAGPCWLVQFAGRRSLRSSDGNRAPLPIRASLFRSRTVSPRRLPSESLRWRRALTFSKAPLKKHISTVLSASPRFSLLISVRITAPSVIKVHLPHDHRSAGESFLNVFCSIPGA